MVVCLLGSGAQEGSAAALRQSLAEGRSKGRVAKASFRTPRKRHNAGS